MVCPDDQAVPVAPAPTPVAPTPVAPAVRVKDLAVDVKGVGRVPLEGLPERTGVEMSRDDRVAEVVRMRNAYGASYGELARILDVSTQTIYNDLKAAGLIGGKKAPRAGRDIRHAKLVGPKPAGVARPATAPEGGMFTLAEITDAFHLLGVQDIEGVYSVVEGIRKNRFLRSLVTGKVE